MKQNSHVLSGKSNLASNFVSYFFFAFSHSAFRTLNAYDPNDNGMRKVDRLQFAMNYCSFRIYQKAGGEVEKKANNVAPNF